jgi:hypothetical protein
VVHRCTAQGAVAAVFFPAAVKWWAAGCSRQGSLVS